MTKAPILDAPGFAKKLLAKRHMDLARRCAGQCVYCSTAATTPMRVHRGRLKMLAAAQLGAPVDPTRAHGVAIAWDAEEMLRRLAAQLHGKPRGWLAGETVMLSQLTDAFLGEPLRSGLTARAVDMVLESGVMAPVGDKGPGQFRVLTKCSAVARPEWIRRFTDHRQHFTVGLSMGTLDDALAARMEPATSLPSARVRAMRRLQRAGVRTFGMLCPVHLDALDDQERPLDALIAAIQPEQCERIWAEPYNDRNNWTAVRDAYAAGSPAWHRMESVYGDGAVSLWSEYATRLYTHLHDAAQAGGWSSKLRYLLYEDQIAEQDAPRFAGLDGVLLQSAPQAKGERAGYSINQHIAALQRNPLHGRATL